MRQVSLQTTNRWFPQATTSSHRGWKDWRVWRSVWSIVLWLGKLNHNGATPSPRQIRCLSWQFAAAYRWWGDWKVHRVSGRYWRWLSFLGGSCWRACNPSWVSNRRSCGFADFPDQQGYKVAEVWWRWRHISPNEHSRGFQNCWILRSARIKSLPIGICSCEDKLPSSSQRGRSGNS